MGSEKTIGRGLIGALLLMFFSGCIAGDTWLAVRAKTELGSGRILLLDVRSEADFRKEHIPGAQSLPLNSEAFEEFLRKPLPEAQILIYCASGKRSRQALERFREAGITNAADLSGGISAWKRAGYPLEGEVQSR